MQVRYVELLDGLIKQQLDKNIEIQKLIHLHICIPNSFGMMYNHRGFSNVEWEHTIKILMFVYLDNG